VATMASFDFLQVRGPSIILRFSACQQDPTLLPTSCLGPAVDAALAAAYRARSGQLGQPADNVSILDEWSYFQAAPASDSSWPARTLRQFQAYKAFLCSQIVELLNMIYCMAELLEFVAFIWLRFK
jgi:hypothetical protein